MEAEKLFLRLKNDYKKIFITENRINKIAKNQYAFIARRDLQIMYDGLFLKSVTIFESFIEELFIGLLYDNYELKTRKKVQKHTFPSRKLVMNFLKHKNNYIELMPYSKLRDSSKIFFNENNPFLSIQENSKNSLNEIYVIRNAIAHNSQFALIKYKKLLQTKGVNNPQLVKSPSSFLKSYHSNNQSIFKNYILELNYIANYIVNYR